MSGAVTTHTWLRRGGVWFGTVVGFFVALHLIWPMPAGIIAWSIVFSSIIALLAIGIALIYRSHRVINFAMADLGAVPASLAVTLVGLEGWSWWIAVPFALLVAVALGSATEFVVIRRFEKAPRLVLMVATIGLAQVLAGIAKAVPEILSPGLIPPDRLPAPFSFSFSIWPIILHGEDLIAVVATVVTLLTLFAFLRFTDLGIALRASSQSADRASLLGVNVGIVHNVAWVAATLVAAVAMILRAGVLGLPLGPAFGPSVLFRALAAAVIGRMENFAVIFAAACGIGILETAILWNEGSTALLDPVLFVVVLGALLLQRRRREAPDEGQPVSSWDDAAKVPPVPRELAHLPEVRWAGRGIVAVAALGVLLLPAVLDDRYTNLAAAVVIYAIIAVSLVILTGWAGEISLGQMAFVAIGSAAAGAANVHWGLDPILSFLLAGAVGAVASVIIGVPALRIRGLMLSVTTLAFAVATSSWLLNRDNLPFLPDSLTDRVTRYPITTPWGDVSIASETAFYFVCVAGLAAVLLAVRGLQRSRNTRDIVAARENSRNAQAFRLSPARAKLLAFALSGFFASFAGGLLALHQQALGQQIFTPVESLRALTMVVVGGLGSVPGAILGAIFLKSTEWFTVVVPYQYRYLFTFAGSGIGILLVLWLLPGGFGSVLYGIRARYLRWVARRRSIVVPALVTDLAARSPARTVIPARVRATARRRVARPAAPAADSFMLSVRDVDASYGHVQVLFGVSIAVRAGETIALLGTNGAGKSTVLRAASGLLAPERGTIIFDGADISGLPPHRIAARGLVHVPAGHSVFPELTVAENLRMGAWLYRRDHALVHSQTERVLDLFPGLRDRLPDTAADLSGGQQRMLAVAMSLLTRPKVLLIDELSLGLAPLVVEQLLRVMEQLHREGVTVIIVEQSVDTALRVADRSFFLEKGAIRHHSLTAELYDRPDILRSIFLEGMATATGGELARVRSEIEPSAAGEPAVVLAATAITKRFGGLAALDDVSVELREGEILGLIGPNGAGKTTLFDVISGFLVPNVGRVTLDGVDITRLRPQQRARLGLGRSFQDARLFGDLTTFQTLCVALDHELALWDPLAASLHLPNVRRSERRVGARADELIEIAGLGDSRDKFVSDLSTGTRRLVDLACHIGMRPRVILLDEPSAGIAQREAEALAPLLLQVRELTGASMLVIEHDLRLVTAVSDRIMALDLGREVITGDADTVLHDPQLVNAYLGGWRETRVRDVAVTPG